MACLNELWGNQLHAVGRHREPNSIGRSLKLWIDGRRGRYSDQFPSQINQCASTIARVDRGIGLHGIGNAPHRAVERTDDAIGHGLCNAERIANRQHLLPDAQLRGNAERRYRQARFRRRYLYHGQIIWGISAYDSAWKGLASIEHDLYALCSLHHMVIGNDVAS